MMHFFCFALLWSSAAAQAYVSGCWITMATSQLGFYMFSIDWPNNGHLEFSTTFNGERKSGGVGEYMYSSETYIMSFRQIMASFGGSTQRPFENRFHISLAPNRLMVEYEGGTPFGLVRPGPTMQLPFWCLRIPVTPAPTPSPTPEPTPEPTPRPTPQPPMRITLPPGVTDSTSDSNVASVALTQTGVSTTLVSTASDTPTTSAADRSDNVGMDNASVDIGLIVGCVIGGLACLIGVILAVFFVAKRRQKEKGDTQSVDDGVAMTTPPQQGKTAVYGAAPRGVNQEAVVGSYKSADMNTNYIGLRNVAPSANGQYVDMQMGGNSTGSLSTYGGMPTSEEYTTGQLEY